MTRLTVFPQRILRIPSNQDEGVRSSRNNIYYPLRAFLLQHYSLWAQKRWRHLPTDDSNMPGETNRKMVEAYVDDDVIKTRHVETLIDDLRLTLYNL